MTSAYFLHATNEINKYMLHQMYITSVGSRDKSRGLVPCH
jgi:hypothetical protein